MLKKEVAKPSSPSAKLDTYISSCLKRGMSKQQVKTYLEGHGWQKDMVEKAFMKHK